MSTIHERIASTRQIVDEALARAAVRSAERDYEQACKDGDNEAASKARTRLLLAQQRAAR